MYMHTLEEPSLCKSHVVLLARRGGAAADDVSKAQVQTQEIGWYVRLRPPNPHGYCRYALN